MLVTSDEDYEDVLLNLLFCPQYYSFYLKNITFVVGEQSTS